MIESEAAGDGMDIRFEGGFELTHTGDTCRPDIASIVSENQLSPNSIPRLLWYPVMRRSLANGTDVLRMRCPLLITDIWMIYLRIGIVRSLLRIRLLSLISSGRVLARIESLTPFITSFP